MKLSDIFETVSENELKYPVSIGWLVGGNTWMSLPDAYWQDGKLVIKPGSRKLHDGEDDSAVREAIAAEIKKMGTLPRTTFVDAGRYSKWTSKYAYPVVDGIKYSVGVHAPTVDGNLYGKAALE